MYDVLYMLYDSFHAKKSFTKLFKCWKLITISLSDGVLQEHTFGYFTFHYFIKVFLGHYTPSLPSWQYRGDKKWHGDSNQDVVVNAQPQFHQVTPKIDFCVCLTGLKLNGAQLGKCVYFRAPTSLFMSASSMKSDQTTPWWCRLTSFWIISKDVWAPNFKFDWCLFSHGY